MPYGIYLSAEGAAAQATRIEVLSNNLANVDTPGFKRQLAILQARHAEAVLQGEAEAGSGSVNDMGGGIEVKETVTDFSAGVLKRTEVPTDVAIDGEGFFVVDKDGQQRLTRAGNFRLTSAGQLITQNGFPVLTEGGETIGIDPKLPWNVSDSGVVRQGALQLPLALVKPQSPADLVPEGDNLYRPLSTPQPLPADERSVRAGFLELSSVKPTAEMMELIEASRAFEANVRLVQHQDQALGQLLSRVLRQA